MQELQLDSVCNFREPASRTVPVILEKRLIKTKVLFIVSGSSAGGPFFVGEEHL